MGNIRNKSEEEVDLVVTKWRSDYVTKLTLNKFKKYVGNVYQ